jgi:ribosomal protein S18 acetylase RimI-like enzyme
VWALDKVYVWIHLSSLDFIIVVNLGMSTAPIPFLAINSGGQTPAAPFRIEELSHTSSSESIDAARQLLLEYGCFVASQTGVASFCFGSLEAEAADLPQSYLNQKGGAILARVGDKPIGFVAWRSLTLPQLASAWELKRLWTRPEARNTGVGRGLVQAVIERAHTAQKTRLFLDTEPNSMAAALRLYRSLGFADCEPYNGRSLDGILYLEKVLCTS